MYKLEKTTYGIKLTFSGYIEVEEMKQWREDSRKFLKTISGKYLLLVDMCELKPIPQEARNILMEGQGLYRQDHNPNAGIERSAVLVDSVVTKMQMERTSKETGLNKKERFFSVNEAGWEKKVDDWLKKGI